MGRKMDDMAIHREPAGIPIEAIDEYIRASELSLSFKKADGGCLGYPATLLLFCVIDALGRYLALDKNNKIPKGEPFYALKSPCFGLSLTTDQIKRLEWWYRNGLAHNSALPPGACLTGEEGAPFDFAPNGEPVKVRVFALHRMVKQAWDRFDKSLIAPSKVFDPRRLPIAGFDSAESVASPVASSGCPVQPKIREL